MQGDIKITKAEAKKLLEKTPLSDRKLSDVNTMGIMGHLAYRHRVFLLTLSNVLTLTLWVLSSAKK